MVNTPLLIQAENFRREDCEYLAILGALGEPSKQKTPNKMNVNERLKLQPFVYESDALLLDQPGPTNGIIKRDLPGS